MSENSENIVAPGEDPPEDHTYIFHAVGKALTWDYVRGGLSIFVLMGVVGVMTPLTMAWTIFAALLIASIGYMLNTVYRHGLRLEMSDEGLRSGWRSPLGATGPVLFARRSLAWSGLEALTVKYFARKHNEGKEGWIMLRLSGKDAAGKDVTITFDGAHEGFSPVLTFALAHARDRGLMLDEATLANLEALGFFGGEARA